MLVIALLHAGASGQSLGEAARKEAERRKSIEQQGVSARVIQDADLTRIGAKGNLGIFSPVPGDKPRPPASLKAERGSPAPFRNKIQKLEREIRQTEEKLAEMRARVARERWAPPRVGRLSRNGRSRVSEERLRSQIQRLETRLNYLRQDRSETYSAGRRAGFLPGELDGKGILP